MVTPELGLIIWQLIIFGSLVLLLGKFAWKPIISALKERESHIEDALKSAERAKAEMEQLQASNEKLLQEARLEKDKILKEASAIAATIMNEAKEKASLESGKMVEQAKLAINAEKNAALIEVKNTAATLSIEIAEKILRAKLGDNAAQQALVAEFLKDSKLN